MSFMQLECSVDSWYVVETSNGTDVFPFDVAGDVKDVEELADYCEGEPISYEIEQGFCARYSAPGYLDCTSWVGPYSTADEAIDAAKENYGEEEDM